MVPKPLSLQDAFIKKALEEKLLVTIFLVNGLKLKGTITEADSFSMLLSRGSLHLLVYKHVVASILPDVPVVLRGSDVVEKSTGRGR
jgi:host factor-I protein